MTTRRDVLKIILGSVAVTLTAPAFPGEREERAVAEALDSVTLRFMTPDGRPVGDAIRIPPEAWDVTCDNTSTWVMRLNRTLTFDAPGAGTYRVCGFVGDRYVGDLTLLGGITTFMEGDCVSIHSLAMEQLTS